jgi:hypothetical protein
VTLRERERHKGVLIDTLWSSAVYTATFTLLGGDWRYALLGNVLGVALCQGIVLLWNLHKRRQRARWS